MSPATMEKKGKGTDILAQLESGRQQAAERKEQAVAALRKVNEDLAQAMRGDRPTADIESLTKAKQLALTEAAAAEGIETAAGFVLAKARARIAAERTVEEIPARLQAANDDIGALEIKMHDMHDLLTGGSMVDPRNAFPPGSPVWSEIYQFSRRLDALSNYWRSQVAPWLERL